MHPLDALGNPVRRDILRALRSAPLSVGDLAARFPVSRPAISRHLKMLEQAGLIEFSEEGTKNLYTIRQEGLASVREFLDEFWDAALSNLAELAQK